MDGWVVVAVALMVPQARCMMSFACVGLGGEDRRGIARDAGIFWCVVRGITGTGGVSDGRLPVLAGVGTAWRCSQAVAVIGARLVGWTLGVYLLPDEPGQWRFVSIKEIEMSIVRMTDLALSGKRVLIRQDLNVPIDQGRITSEQRIIASLPTIRVALERGAAVMVTSHLGRPKEGVWSEEDSLAPVAKRLSQLLGIEVPLRRDWVDGVQVAPGAVGVIGKLPNECRRS